MGHSQPAAPRSPALRRVGWIVTTLFWSIQFFAHSVVTYLWHPKIAPRYFEPRLIVAALGVVATLLLVEGALRLRRQPLRQQIIVNLMTATLTCLVISLANYWIFVSFLPWVPDTQGLGNFLDMAFSWLWFFYAIVGVVAAISHNAELRDGEARLAELRILAQKAQLKALRYQLNPHFLFNTLNSIASLAARKRHIEAELMVENLSDFLRSSLEIDPHEDIPLSRELELQQLYLQIEMVRFPDRLSVSIDVPIELQKALVPSLITQPLIENAIKYAVARSTTPVMLRIAAREDGEWLDLSVANHGGSAGAACDKGTGIGLANVTARLLARYGDRQAVHAAKTADGFEVELRLPLNLVPDHSADASNQVALQRS